MTNYHPLANQIVQILKENKCWYETFEHEPVRTSEEAAKIRTDYTLEQGAKALIIRIKTLDKEKFFVMLVFPAHMKFDKEKVLELFSAKDIRFMTVEELSSLSEGLEPGGVPPFGNLLDLKVVADKSLFDREKIIFNAGDRGFSVAMKSEDYRELVEPQVEEIT